LVVAILHAELRLTGKIEYLKRKTQL
jgi:hypothetical protein